LADAKNTTVAELTGTRRRYSRIQVPEKLREFVGEDEIIIDHIDEGINANEILHWSEFWALEKKEQQKAKGTR
jgi:hypothetical protein